MTKQISLLVCLVITISILSCNQKNPSGEKATISFTYNDKVYDLNSMSETNYTTDIRFIGNIELKTTNYEISENFGVSISYKPNSWKAKEAIDKWQNSVIETWKNNSIGVKRLKEKCDLPCEDLVFTFALEGLYYYNRIYISDNKIIELMAIYDDPNEYQNFRKTYDSFGK